MRGSGEAGDDMGVFCRCHKCHAHVIADLREAQHRGDMWGVLFYINDERLHIPPLVDVADPVETLIALGCDCVRYHTALPMPQPKYLPPRDWRPGDD